MLNKIRIKVSIWWARLTGRPTTSVVSPKLKKITYQRFERACLLVDIDPDKFRSGDQGVGDAELDDPYADGRQLLELIVTPSTRPDLSMFEKHIAQQLCAHVLSTFFFECVKRFREQQLELTTTLSEQESLPFSRKGAPALH